jgi:hypothetical protein
MATFTVKSITTMEQSAGGYTIKTTNTRELISIVQP